VDAEQDWAALATMLSFTNAQVAADHRSWGRRAGSLIGLLLVFTTVADAQGLHVATADPTSKGVWRIPDSPQRLPDSSELHRILQIPAAPRLTGEGANASVEKPVWHFSVIAGISQVTSNYYGGFSAAKTLIQNQFVTINSRFNTPGAFDGVLQFTVDSIYEFTGDPLVQIFQAHPLHDYRVVYDGFPSQGGGWYGPPTNTIHHSWPVTWFGGTFGSYATDGIVHEFGHARGAIDLYALQVDAGKNPVNGAPYNAETSIMNYPYGVTIWDQHSVGLINLNADQVYSNSAYVTGAFPTSINILVRSGSGAHLPGTSVKLYPADWYSGGVTGTPSLVMSTDENGAVHLAPNPFGPIDPPEPWCGRPWCIMYPNFLVAAEYGGYSAYGWMPLNQVQNVHLAKGDSGYTLSLVLLVPCGCPQQGDINGDGVIDVFDVIEVIGVAFSGSPDIQNPACPKTRADVDNNGVTDVFDVIYLIATAFSGGPNPVDPCGP